MSSLHHNTPSLTVVDPRGLAVRSVAYLRSAPKQQVQALITRQVFNARGFLRQQWDPRLFDLHQTDPAVQPNLAHSHSLGGQLINTDSVDAGRQVKLFGNGGQLLEQWDGRGARQRFEYTALLQRAAVFEQGASEAAERCVERLSYAGMTSAEAARNRCGRLIRHDDPAGTVFHQRYGVLGELTEHTRRFRAEDAAVDWPLLAVEREAQLQAESFTTTWQHDASGRVLEQVDATGNCQQSRYGVEGMLSSSAIVFKSGVRKTLVDQRSFNASLQVLSEKAGNGVVSLAEYSNADGRLTRLVARREGTPGELLQDLSYRYDRIGNVLSISDAAQPIRWTSNVQVAAISTFEYDSLSRLTKATGRENTHNGGTSALPGRVAFGATDDNLWRTYTRQYCYDRAGNLTQMRHVPATGSGYTQQMGVGERSNHSVIEREGANAPGLGEGFDQGGNLQALAPGQLLSWNARNQLARVAQVLRDSGEHDDEVYVYDGAGQRVIKRRVAHAKAQVHTHEVLYLPGLELHRHGATGEWLNVVLAQAGRHAVRGLQWHQGRPHGLVDEHLRFSLSDHLGSSTLELDEEAGLLSQESYYPFGATAWWAAKNAVEANYKTIRYSGKERDATGLYYYGFRYYAPWLMRWISPDPSGDVDGLNLYAMVGNNPLGFVDAQGLQRNPISNLTHLMVIAMLATVAAYVESNPYAFTLLVLSGVMAFSLIGLIGVRHLFVQREWAEDTAEQAAQWQTLLEDIGTLGRRFGVTEEEIMGFADFVQEYEADKGDEGISYGLSTSARGGLFGYVGPSTRKDRAHEAVQRENNPSFTLTRLGYDSIQIRAPARRTGASPLPAGGLPDAEVRPVTRAQGAGRRSASPGAEASASDSATEASSDESQRLVIAVDDILDDLRGDQGEIIRGVIDRLEAGALRFTRGHAFAGAQNTRSFDLPGYRGQRRRGAYRVLIQHVGGLNYRAVRVMNPHRR